MNALSKIIATSLLAGAALAAHTVADAAPQYAQPGTLRRVVQEYYKANDRVQLAVFRDACLHWDMFKESRTARARLSRANARSYDTISKFMGDAYAATSGTDSAVEQLAKDFCTAADNR
jgi:hypothetical protein